MDLIDRLSDHDLWVMNGMLAALEKLPENALDTPISGTVQAMCYEPEQRTIRDLLHHTIFTKEVWIAAVERQGFPDASDTSLEGLRRRAEVALPMFAALVKRVRDAGEWDTEFVDELCEEPVPFTFGGMIAHVITTTAYRRAPILAALRELGAEIGHADPLEWEQSAARA